MGTNKEALSSLPRPVLPSDIVASHLLEVRFQVSARWRYLGLLGGLRGRWWASISLSSSRRRCSASWRSRVARVTCSCVVEQLSERQSPRRRCFCRWRCLLLARHLLRSFKKKSSPISSIVAKTSRLWLHLPVPLVQDSMRAERLQLGKARDPWWRLRGADLMSPRVAGHLASARSSLLTWR